MFFYCENLEDLEVIKYVYVILRDRGCDEFDVDVVELKGKYEMFVVEINV